MTKYKKENNTVISFLSRSGGRSGGLSGCLTYPAIQEREGNGFPEAEQRMSTASPSPTVTLSGASTLSGPSERKDKRLFSCFSLRNSNNQISYDKSITVS